MFPSQQTGLPQRSGCCKLDLCDCRQFRVHKYKFTLSCIECGHLADFHDVDQTVIEAQFSMSRSIVIMAPKKLVKPGPEARPEPAVPSIVEENIPQAVAISEAYEIPDAIRSNQEALNVIASSMKQQSALAGPESKSAQENFLQKPNDYSEFASVTMLQTVEDICTDIPSSSLFCTRRDYIIRELFTTEQTYVRNLTFLINQYKVVMQDHHSLKDECPAIFISLPAILLTNKTLLHRLHRKVMRWTPYSTIGDDLAYFSPFLNVYKSYCSYHESAVKRAQDLLQSSPEFHELNEVNRKNPDSGGLDIFSFLIMPVQRVPRYTLLVQELVKHTDTTHPDYKALKTAMDCFSKLATEINEGIRESENRSIIFDIQNRFSPPITLVEPHRRLVYKGGIWAVEKSTKIRRYIFLLSDLFLECSRISEKDLSLVRAFNFQDTSIIRELPYERYSFGLCSENFSCMYVCDDFESYEKWTAAIEKVKEKTLRPTSKANNHVIPIWQPDYSSNRCMICKSEFWMLLRRHHCRMCGRLICDPCSSSVSNNQQIGRVCMECNKSKRL